MKTLWYHSREEEVSGMGVLHAQSSSLQCSHLSMLSEACTLCYLNKDFYPQPPPPPPPPPPMLWPVCSWCSTTVQLAGNADSRQCIWWPMPLVASAAGGECHWCTMHLVGNIAAAQYNWRRMHSGDIVFPSCVQTTLLHCVLPPYCALSSGPADSRVLRHVPLPAICKMLGT